MAVVDTKITDWFNDYGGTDSNTPVGATLVGTNWDDEIRNMKSVVRDESLNKAWERYGLVYTRVNATQFTIDGDHTAKCPVNRKILALHDNGVTAVGAINSASYSGGTLKTTVNVTFDIFGSALNSDLNEIRFSCLLPVGGAVPRNVPDITTNIQYGEAAGGPVNYTVTMNPALGTLAYGTVVYIKFNTPNSSGAITLNINGTGAKAVKRSRNTGLGPTMQDLLAGDIATGSIHQLIFDGANNYWQMLSGSGLEVDAASLVSLFAKSSASFDATTCVAGGYFRVMTNMLVSGFRTKPIAPGAVSIVPLPIPGGASVTGIMAYTSSWVDNTFELNPLGLDFDITTPTAPKIKVANPSGAMDLNITGTASVIVICALA